MSQHKTPARKEAMAEIIDTYRTAHARGGDGWRAVETAYPGIPTDVVAAAMVEAESEATEAWWQKVERQIDGEIIRNALAKAGS